MQNTQVSFIYFSGNVRKKGIAEWVSLYSENELVSLYSTADIRRSRFNGLEKANFAIVYPQIRSAHWH